MPRISYVNGQYTSHLNAHVHIEDRGFQFGDSVYEVIALINGQMADARGHLDRLERSLAELDIPMPISRQALLIVIKELIRRNRLKNAMIYMQVSRGMAPRKFEYDEGMRPSLVMTVRPMSFDIPARKKSAKNIIILPDMRWRRCDIKTTNLLAQVLAKQYALDHGAEDAWFEDDDGFITEGSASNAWILTKQGELITRPTANHNILKGVTLTALKYLCDKEGIVFVERPFSKEEAYNAVEAFGSSAVALIAPIAFIDDHQIGSGKIGSITEKIFDLYMDYITRTTEQQKWQTK